LSSPDGAVQFAASACGGPHQGELVAAEETLVAANQPEMATSTCSSARQVDHQKTQITGDKISRSPEEERMHIESHGEIGAKKSMIVI